MPSWDEKLHSAAKRGDVSEMKQYIEEGASLNGVNIYNETALIIAVSNTQTEGAKYLLDQKGIDLHVQGLLTGAALTFSIFSGQFELAEQLILKEDQFNNSDYPGALTWTLLNDNMELLDLMVTKGAKVDLPGTFGYQQASKSIWKPEPDPQSTPFHHEYASFLKHTLLGLAIYLKKDDMAKHLLRVHKADPNIPSDERYPLEIAASSNNPDMVDFLLKNNADPDLVLPVLQQRAAASSSSGYSITPSINEDILLKLKTASAAKKSSKAVSADNFSKPRGEATSQQPEEFLSVLLLQQVLHIAATNGTYETVKRLVEKYPFLVNSKDMLFGSTPLSKAVFSRHVNVACYLLDKGADPSVTSIDGKSAFDMAQLSLIPEIHQNPLYKKLAERLATYPKAPSDYKSTYHSATRAIPEAYPLLSFGFLATKEKKKRGAAKASEEIPNFLVDAVTEILKKESLIDEEQRKIQEFYQQAKTTVDRKEEIDEALFSEALKNVDEEEPSSSEGEDKAPDPNNQNPWPSI